MQKTVEKCLDVGKKAFVAIAAAGAMSCATPHFQAKRDYLTYPDYKKEIALYNITGILAEKCRINEEGVACSRMWCSHYERTYNYVAGGRTEIGSLCTQWETISFEKRWDEIRSVALKDSNCIQINNSDKCDIWVYESQTHDLIEAIRIYLRER